MISPVSVSTATIARAPRSLQPCTMFIPMPPLMLDVMLCLNITIILLILMAVLNSNRPVEFSTFPTVLLFTALFRLALNVSSTRLILLEGEAGVGKTAIAEGLAVTALPGPSAPLVALLLSGLPSDRFFFGGFLPPKSGARRQALQALRGLDASLVFFEGASRLAACLAENGMWDCDGVSPGPEQPLVPDTLRQVRELVDGPRLHVVDDTVKADKASAVLALVGAVNVPIIHFSVEWWSSLHQGQTVVKGAMDPEMLIPLLINIAGFTFLFGALLLRRIRTEVLYRERRKKWVKELVLAAEGRS